jgi:hypothetical protein
MPGLERVTGSAERPWHSIRMVESCGSNSLNCFEHPMPITYGPFPLAGVKFSSNSHTGGSVPAVFDAILYRAIGGSQQLKLTVKLRINLWRLAGRARDLA